YIQRPALLRRLICTEVIPQNAVAHAHGFFGADQGERAAAPQGSPVAGEQGSADGGRAEFRVQPAAAVVSSATADCCVVQEPAVSNAQAGYWQGAAVVAAAAFGSAAEEVHGSAQEIEGRVGGCVCIGVIGISKD